METSALVAAILEGDTAVRTLVDSGSRLVTSALTVAESSRALVRAAASGRLKDAQDLQAAEMALMAVSRRLHFVPVSADILARAGRAFPIEPVRTLDAIHLATLEALGESPASVTVVTRANRVAGNARMLGYHVA